MKNQKILLLTQSALFAAIIFVVTMIHVPAATGYVHLGDAFIYIAACILPTGWAMGAAAVGAGLSDATSGFPMYIIPSIIIKSLTVLVFTSKGRKILVKRNMIGSVLGGLICIFGYYIAEYFMYGEFSPLAGFIGNCIQAAGSLLAFMIVASILDKYNIKIKLQRGED